MAVNNFHKIKNYNRIINLKFYNTRNDKRPGYEITCPLRGRKPDIEITCQLLPSAIAQAINIRVKNLYLDLAQNSYAFIEVEAGYEGNLTLAFRGSILYMFRESPGPQSTTVIECLLSDLGNWQDTYLDIDVDQNATLKDIMEEVSNKLGLAPPIISEAVAGRTIKENQFALVGKAVTVVNEIKNRFSFTGPKADNGAGLVIVYDEPRFKVYEEGQSANFHNKWNLNLLSTPPQLVGGGSQAVVATITAPWVPNMKPGDEVTINTNYYTTSHVIVYSQPQITMLINTMTIHFSTVKGINEMILQGSVISSKKEIKEEDQWLKISLAR